jgi:chorismate mutase
MSDDSELARLRARMDDVNRRLVDALHERARLCRTIGAWKRERGLPAVDAAREQAMLAAMLAAPPADGFSREQLEAVLREVFAASRALVSGS